MNGLKSDVNSLIEVNRLPFKTDSTSKTNVSRHFFLNVRSSNPLLTDLTKDSHTPPIQGLAGGLSKSAIKGLSGIALSFLYLTVPSVCLIIPQQLSIQYCCLIMARVHSLWTCKLSSCIFLVINWVKVWPLKQYSLVLAFFWDIRVSYPSSYFNKIFIIDGI